jgi:hypothetical protein
MRTNLIMGLVAVVALAWASSAAAQNSADAANCSTYARNRADSEGGAGRGAVGGAARGAIGGALFGAIIDGSDGAKKGAAVAGGIGAVGGGMRGSRDREAAYNRYYNECMNGQR